MGCGPGTEAVILAKMGYDVTALYFCPEMVKLTEEKAKSENLSIKAVQGDTEDLPFEDGSFDIIVCHYALWAFPHPQKAFDEWFRVHRKGGMLEFTGGEWTMKDFGFFRRQWAKITFRRRARYGNNRTTPTGPMKEHLQGLWSQTAKRPEADLEMLSKAGFGSVMKIDKVDRRIYSGIRYIEYGFYKVHYLITAIKP